MLLSTVLCLCSFLPSNDERSSVGISKSKSEILVSEGDTIFIGTFPRSKYTSLVHVFVENKEETDLHINEITISDWRIEISSSPTITKGAKGTIVLILDTEKMREGIQYKTVNVKTDSKTLPEWKFYVKYDIKPYKDPEPIPSVVKTLKNKDK